MRLNYLLPRHFFILGLFILLCILFTIQVYGHSNQKLLVQTFETVTNPQPTYKLPCDLKFQLGKTGGGLRNTYGAWLQKKDGSLFLLRVCTAFPELGMDFDEINIEILPKTDPHTKQFPKDFKSGYFFAPTVVPTPIQKPITLTVGNKNIKLEMKLIHQVMERSNFFDGPPFCYKNLSFVVRASESNELGASGLIPTPTPEISKNKKVKTQPPIKNRVIPLVPPSVYLDLPAFIKQYRDGFYTNKPISFLSAAFLLVLFVFYGNPILGFLIMGLFFALLFYFAVPWLRAVKCPECGHPIQHKQSFCGKCGYGRKAGD